MVLRAGWRRVSARILIIDDNVQPRRQPARSARRSAGAGRGGGPRARRAERARAAKHDGFDVAVVDVKLPDASGVDLIRPLRAASPQGEVVLVTGFATVDTALAALQGGAFAFILKSFRPEELISTVAQALEKIALKREREEYQRRYRALVDATDMLIVGLDAAGRSRSATRGSRRSPASTPRPRWGARSPSSSSTRPITRSSSHAFAAVPRRGAAVDVDVGLRDAVGAIRRVRWHLSGARGVGKRTDLIYGVGIDVTERRALERRAADAEALNAMAPLALGLAHEIRNPLNAAVLELHLLSRSIDR
jgi:ActR/RegA family two-component response regulator